MGKKLLCEELLVLKETQISGGTKRKGAQKVTLRVASWNKGKPMLENRIQVIDLVDGVWYPFKAKGISKEDVQIIIDNQDKIFNVMNNFKG